MWSVLPWLACNHVPQVFFLKKKYMKEVFYIYYYHIEAAQEIAKINWSN
jgi:hypothetical protein